MIQKIKSRRVELPPIYLVENEEDFKQLPRGLPYIIGTQKELEFIRIFLEFQILYKSCKKTGLPIKWLDSLRKLGYNADKIKDFKLLSGGKYFASSQEGNTKIEIDDFIEEKYLVNFDSLSNLKVLPKWMDDITASIQTNIIDEVQFNPTAFNKQLELNTGYASIKHNLRNLLILDVSSTMPTSIVVGITTLAKLMSKKFYADIIVTGGQSFFINYDDMENSDIVEIARRAGRSNESEMFRAIVAEKREYNTVISFGDNDSPGSNVINNFTCETLYSLHTENTSNITGYALSFKPKTTHIVNDWVNTLS